jgi:micrococcal nuclease
MALARLARRALPLVVALTLLGPVFPVLGAAEWRTCVRVVDGDTLVLDGGERVRLIGVDTPELHHPRKPVEYFAQEASDYVRRRVQGQRVRLEYDQQRRDRYGRTLAYVFMVDGTLLNLRIIEQGYGFAYTKYPFRSDYMARFRAAERAARTGSRGLWAGGGARER